MKTKKDDSRHFQPSREPDNVIIQTCERHQVYLCRQNEPTEIGFVYFVGAVSTAIVKWHIVKLGYEMKASTLSC